MKIFKLLVITLSGFVAVLNISCVSNDPNELSPNGPTSEHSAIPFNRPLEGEGQGALGGFGSR